MNDRQSAIVRFVIGLSWTQCLARGQGALLYRGLSLCSS
jgi:hypothetical protein